MADDLKKLRRALTTCKTWVTRCNIRLSTLMEASDIDIPEVECAVNDVKKKLDAFDAAQSAYEMEVEDEEVEKCIEEASNFRDNISSSVLKATTLLKAKSPKVESGDGKSNSDYSSLKVGVNLPKLDLPKFDGTITDWQPFWDKFSALIGNSTIPVISKFTYLSSLLVGEAKRVVQGVSVTEKNYEVVCKLLEERYGRTDRVIFAHIEQLLNISVPKNVRVKGLWEMYDNLQGHIRSLKSLGIDGDQYGVLLTPIVLSRLPGELRMEWAREGEGHESDLNWLLDFLQNEIARRERSQTMIRESIGASNHGDVGSSENKGVTQVATATALHSVAGDSCKICGRRGHAIEKCYGIVKKPVGSRRQVLKMAGICFKCLSWDKAHNFIQCKQSCSKCKGSHHAVLCNEGVDGRVSDNSNRSVKSNQSDVNQSAPTQNNGSKNQDSSKGHEKTNDVTQSVVTVSTVSSARVLLQVIKATVRGVCGFADANILLDSGSDRSYISQSLVNKLGPKWLYSQEVAYSTFGKNMPEKADVLNVYGVHLQGSGEEIQIRVTEVPVVCGALSMPAVPSHLLQGLSVVEVMEKSVQIDMLIGLDVYWRLVKPEFKILQEGLVAQQTLFGWVISGSVSEKSVSVGTSHINFTQCRPSLNITDEISHKFWDLEMVGVSATESLVENPVVERFREGVQFSEVDSRYTVALPWKDPDCKQKLLNNEKLARCRLERLSFRLAKDPELEAKYHQVISTMQDEGIIEEVFEESGDHVIYYMPHRPVIKESSLTTKIRPVFDASAKGYNKLSLNDCMEAGPSLIPELPGVLMRFRRWKVAICADITKAFLQIGVVKEDRDVHRFLWNDNGVIRKMKFTRVPFGNKGSMFLLNATIKHHLSKFATSHVVRELIENMYVDNWLSGCDDESSGCEMIREAKMVMEQASMFLTQWGSNSSEVGDIVTREFQDNFMGSGSMNVLGMRWVASLDCFTFEVGQLPKDLGITKRIALGLISRLFDPLGFAAPFVTWARILFQELWKLNLEWDVPVPYVLENQFCKWITGLEVLRDWKIPRRYTDCPWEDVVALEIHGFGDASQNAYGACIYLRAQTQDGMWSVSLILSRARVAPLKQITLPRLELMAALLCARQISLVLSELRLPADTKYRCWTDSRIVLAWIHSSPDRWKPFVSNRVAEIHNLTASPHWYHCPGKENPADLLTRGMSAEELIHSEFWIHGPAFLTQEFELPLESVGADQGTESGVVEVTGEEKSTVLVTVDSVPTKLFPIERWSSFGKALRVVAWCLRFINNTQKSEENWRTGELSFVELSEAKLFLLREVQRLKFTEEIRVLSQGHLVQQKSSIFSLSPYIGDDGLLRVKGRLEFSGLAEEEKHPIIVPKGDLSCLLARHSHMIGKHRGVNAMLVDLRNQYWIIGARCICKRVKRLCVPCQRQDARSGDQTRAPLPEMRIKPAPPFAITGLDHGGPLYCNDFPGKKFYILLMTCAVTRALHLELVDSLSGETTLMAIRRFIARRGMPSVIMSDNAKGFKYASIKQLELLGPEGPEWKFIAPRAPWWGGWWERLVGSVKSALKRSIGKKVMTRNELETILFEVEGVLNSRPLTFVGEGVDAGTPLTPGHFLIGRLMNSKPNTDGEDHDITADGLVLRSECRERAMEEFWNVWSKEYIRSLPPFRNFQKNGEIAKGSVVLVQDENSSKLLWPLGLVIKGFPGRDGLIRTVLVKTAKGEFVRPIQRVHDLEIANVGDDVIAPVDECVTVQDSLNPEVVTDIENENTTMATSDEIAQVGIGESDEREPKVSRFGRVIKQKTVMDL